MAGGGKTAALLFDNLKGIHDPDYFSVFFRTTTTEIDKGLWPAAKALYAPILKKNDKYIKKAHINEQTKTITFPSGARTTFSYLEQDKHADSWYGSEICREYFDEFQFRTPYQFEVLRSRNRSTAKVPVGIRCSLNPDQDHFVYEWVKPFLDEDGYPIQNLAGKTRYYVILNSELKTSWDREALKAETGKNPKTYSYIPATLADNPYLDADYHDTLDALGEVKRKQLLLGCWHSRANDSLYFNRNWIELVDTAPKDVEMCRAWDLASTKPHPENPKPDYTAGVKMAKGRDGFYYILDADQFQMSPGERNREMAKIAKFDSDDCYQVVPLDPGAAGKVAYQELAKIFIEEGIICKADETRGDKIKRFEPFSAAAQSGLVRVVKSTFNPEMLEIYLKQLEGFTGARSHGSRKDDLVDATSSAFAFLCKKKVLPSFTLQSSNSPSLLASSGLRQNV